ncbi:MAG: NAD-dependent epimerase/dehydratase family protein [Pseudomonadota bacterium]|nr:NAD-dependent epimerase/dehydratase family protein [Pseudomonadota bacterium]
MRVLFTGASSFTGFWFVGRLAAAGAEVVAPLRGAVESYEGVRAERVRWLSQWAEIAPDCAFGEPAFLDLIRARRFDVLCHHAAEARGYREPTFDVAGALAANTRNIAEVFETLRERGCKAVVATGSVFEPDEGAGPEPRRAFSPYGLSKGLTWRTIEYWGETLGLPASKFVIANPFGPFEEARFVAHAVGRWAHGEAVEVRTPNYLRDNIHVDLLSMAYAKFVAEAAAGGAGRSFGPCGYMETQGAFAERLGRELGARLGLAGAVKHAVQTDFSEPLARVNSHVIDPAAYGWSEGKAWDALAGYYRQRGLTATPAQPKRAVEIIGSVDAVNHGFVSGWLAAKQGSEPRYLRAVVDGVERCAVRADLWRPDLREQNICDGHAGFRFAFPGGLNPYADAEVRLEDRETGLVLANGLIKLPRLVGGENSPLASGRDVVAVNVGTVSYHDGGIDLMIETIGPPDSFGAPRSDNATLEQIAAKPVEHPYFAALGLAAARIRMLVRPRDAAAPVDIRLDGVGEEWLRVNQIPGRLPDYFAALAADNLERVSGPGESVARFAATGLSTACRIDAMVRRHFGRGLAQCGTCLDWGAGPGRVALPLARVVAPGLALTAADVDGVNAAFGRAHFADVNFVRTPFLPPLPFADGAFGAIYGVSVLTHLTEAAQFAWLKELRRVARPGAPVIVSAHSEYQLLRTAEGAPELLREAIERGISDSMFDDNLGARLAQKSYYRSTFHTRRYIVENWAEDFEIVRIYPAANGAAQDFVVMRAK